MSKTQAERSKEYRQRKRDAERDGARHETVTKRDDIERDEDVTNVTKTLKLPDHPVTGRTFKVYDGDPLSIYSLERWSRAQAKGYVMPDGAEYDGRLTLDNEIPVAVELGYARRKVGPGQYVFLVPVPGDPAYQQTCKQSTVLLQV